MNLARPFVFWISVVAAVTAMVVVLREVLLPFVAGMVLAYLLNPLVLRIERLGINRQLSTGIIIIFVIGIFAILLFLAVPVIVRELAYFIENLPVYIRRLHALVTDSQWPWARKIIGDGLEEAEHSVGNLTALADEWFGTFVRSVWSGGRALVTILSLVIVTPIV